MKKSLISISLALLMLALPFVSVYAQDGAPPECLGNPLVAYLMAGQTIEAGQLIVCNDAVNLYISYALYEGWRLSDTHVQIDVLMGDVASTVALDDYPVNKKGTPVPGQFDHQMDYDPTVQASTYTIPLVEILGETWDGETYGQDLLIAAHATLGERVTNDVGTDLLPPPEGEPYVTTLSVPFSGDQILDSSLTITCVDDSALDVPYEAILNDNVLGYPVSSYDFSEQLVFDEVSGTSPNNLLVITPEANATCTLQASVVTPGAGEETAWAYDATSGGTFAEITDTNRWSAYLVYTLQPPPVLRDEQWPTGGTVTVAFEDFPIGDTFDPGDYDYNDWVVDIDTTATFSGSSIDLVQITFDITPEARGAGFWHVFHLGIPENIFGSDGQYTLTFFDAGGVEIPEKSDAGTFVASTRNDFVLFHQTASVQDAFEGDVESYPNTIEPEGIVSHYPDIFNTDVTASEHRAYQPPLMTAELSIVFDVPMPFDLLAYDPYSPGNMHGEGLFFDPWLSVDPWWLYIPPYEVHVLDDRLLAVPADWMWPEAGVHIWMAYPKVEEGNPPVFVNTWWCNPDWIYPYSSPYLDSLVYNGPFPEPTFPTCP